MSKIRPIQKNLLVEPPAKQTVSAGGIYIPETFDPNAKGLTRGVIVDMAEDVEKDKYGFAAGKTVLFNKFAYSEIKVPATEAGKEDRVLLLIKEDKIEAVLDE